ncbi:LOW QUALITY PROTEIN: uncharacterized protein LOC108116871 [Drosophila eugracilis]|uniref:LOW QUALITY PROTEIN: uncharacterized protein LOC108116871 n=1 Tax=Drosophila eugracilis TaxID=29029 RepID=UPI001BDAEB68|nr:LOW QUALITY PROTEIN: uncharacterized protein LOC108116871 [Drosophila eugracilis]
MVQIMPQNNYFMDTPSPRDSSTTSDNDENETTGNVSFYTCMVCMRSARKPRVSFCGHLFCTKCIRNWMKMKGSRAKCPYCQSRVGENTLVTVRYGRAFFSRTCRPLRHHRRRLNNNTNYIREWAILPEAAMFQRGYIDYSPEPMPRIRPLPPQMLYQLPCPPMRRRYMPHTFHQRGITFIIMVFLFVAYLNTASPPPF